MTRAVLVAIAVGLGAAAADARDRDPKLERHEHDAGRFSARWPTKPRESVKQVETKAGRLTVTTVAASAANDLTLSVTFTDYPESFATLDPYKVLDGVRDGMKTKGANLISTSGQPAGADGRVVEFPGREFTYDHGKYLARTRAFLAGTRLYQVTATGSKDAVYSKTTEAFLLSFEVRK